MTDIRPQAPQIGKATKMLEFQEFAKIGRLSREIVITEKDRRHKRLHRHRG